MSTKTVNDMIAEMEATNIFTTNQMTPAEYVENLLQFQAMVVKMVAGSDYVEGMRIDEAIFRLESMARAKGLSGDEKVRTAIADLRAVSKEVSISMAGRKGENLVAKTLEYMTRPNTKLYRNVYLCNGEVETELDTVIITDAGIIILEIKNTKEDITFTEDGRMLRSGDVCHDKESLGEKMATKRKLLQERLENEMMRRGVNIPVNIESWIVLSAPKGVRINVVDKFHKEKWCFRTDLNRKIDNYIGRVYYSEDDLMQLSEIMDQMESRKKCFTLNLNFDAIRSDFAEALYAVSQDTIKKAAVKEESQPAQTVEATNIIKGLIAKTYRNKASNAHYFRKLAMVSGFAGAIVLGTVVATVGGLSSK